MTHADARDTIPRNCTIRPVPFSRVRLTDAFWAPRIETNRTVTIPCGFRKCEETGRVDNFAKAAGLKDCEHSGVYPFDDTDIYKILEGAAYSLAVHPDTELDAYCDRIIELVAAAQEPDGYLFTARTNQAPKLAIRIGTARWSMLREQSHELYNLGHLFEAATAHFQATGKRSLLDVAIRAANLIVEVFGPGRNEEAPGHQVVEMGLVKLYRVTGNQAYLDLARFFLEARGPGDCKHGEYDQTHLPVLEQADATGHAVRAGYMFAAMADIAAAKGDRRYVDAVDRLWDDVVCRKLHVTGGVGARGSWEGFGDAYELPNMSAYCETCAAIANVYWAHRMFLLHGHARYIDVLERSLYNGVLSGVGLSGDRFFYGNPLMSMGQHERSEWFTCSCCPSNVARFIPSVPGYAYGVTDACVYVNLYAAGEAELTVARQTVRIVQHTEYPWDGRIGLRLALAEPAEFALALRIPGWARGRPVPSDLYRNLAEPAGARPRLAVNGEDVALTLVNCYATVVRTWSDGDTVELDMPMVVRRVVAHESVAEDRGKVAFERGPLVYCAEWPDQPDERVLHLVVDDTAPVTVEQAFLPAHPVTVEQAFLPAHPVTVEQAFLPAHPPPGKPAPQLRILRSTATALRESDDGSCVLRNTQPIALIPYYAWAHRGKGEMAVWLAREEAAARPLPRPTIGATSTVRVSGDREPTTALNDGLTPANSNDHSMPFLHWWPRFGEREWVEYHFEAPAEVSRVEVYWFDDSPGGGCRVPAAWELFYRDDGTWRLVEDAGAFTVARDTFNEATFKAVRTDALRLEIQMQDGVSGGILEWIVE